MVGAFLHLNTKFEISLPNPFSLGHLDTLKINTNFRYMYSPL